MRLLRILLVLLGLIKGRPARCGVDVLVLAVPVPVHHLAWRQEGPRGSRGATPFGMCEGAAAHRHAGSMGSVATAAGYRSLANLPGAVAFHGNLTSVRVLRFDARIKGHCRMLMQVELRSGCVERGRASQSHGCSPVECRWDGAAVAMACGPAVHPCRTCLEQRPALAHGLVDDEVIEGDGVGQDDVLLHVHQVARARGAAGWGRGPRHRCGCSAA